MKILEIAVKKIYSFNCPIQTEIGKCAKYLEDEFSMEHTNACEFVSRIMNLGIAFQEKQVNVKRI